MAEISRADAIFILQNTEVKCWEEKKPMSYVYWEETFEKAISDMQKLEKIEKIVNEYSFVEQYAYQTLDNIEQILKE